MLVTATDAFGNVTSLSQSAVKDTVAPAVTISSVTSPVDQSLSASGTGEAGSTVVLIVSDGLYAAVQATVVGPGGAWSIANIDVSVLADGPITVYASDTDAAGNAAVSIVHTTKSTFALTSVTDPINSFNAASVSVSGVGPVGATIEVVASDGTNTSASYVTWVAADGTWSISGIDMLSLADGPITFTATSDDGLGHIAQSSLTATKDTLAPAVTLDSVSNPISSLNQHSAAASGTGEVGATVSLVASDGANVTNAYDTTIGAGGTWAISGIDVSTLADGTLTFTATAADSSGNISAVSLTALKDSVAPGVFISSVTDPIDAGNTFAVEVSGTGEVGAVVSLLASDGVNSSGVYTTTVGLDGNWFIAGIDVSSLNDGTITFAATATDAAGNTNEVTITATKSTGMGMPQWRLAIPRAQRRPPCFQQGPPTEAA